MTKRSKRFLRDLRRAICLKNTTRNCSLRPTCIKLTRQMNSLKILHLANDYAGSAVYKNLVTALDQEGLTQIIYCHVRDAGLINKNKVEFRDPDCRIIYSHILNKTIDRILYPLKIKKILADVERKIDLTQV